MTTTVALGEHFKRLLDFSGREDRASFWPYAAVAFVLVMIAGALIFVPIAVTMLQAMQQFAAQHPESVTVTQGPGDYTVSMHGEHPAFVPIGWIILYFVVTFGSAVLLYAAAVARRLHDTGRSGLWGILPLPFILYSSVQMPRLFAAIGAGAEPDMTLFLSVFLSNLLYIITLLVLILLLAGKSTQRPNRFDKTA